ncbi:MAG: hypothetical protein U0175_18755 [Caldilineaceae bacterium]
MRLIFFLLTILLFILACAVPALEFRHYCSDPANYDMVTWEGLRALALGWMGLFVGMIGWYANPFWLFGMLAYLFNFRWVARILLFIALVLALTSFMLIDTSVPADEANVCKLMLETPLIGFYLWLGAMVFGFFVAVRGKRRVRLKPA